MENDKTLYFAYGSCMNNKDFHRTAQSGELLGLATLDNFQLNFNLYAKTRQGGVANIHSDPDSIVLGTLWEINKDDIKHVDKREGHPYIYERSIVKVRLQDNELSAITYISHKSNETSRNDHYDPHSTYAYLIYEGLLETYEQTPNNPYTQQQIREYLYKNILQK